MAETALDRLFNEATNVADNGDVSDTLAERIDSLEADDDVAFEVMSEEAKNVLNSKTEKPAQKLQKETLYDDIVEEEQPITVEKQEIEVKQRRKPRQTRNKRNAKNAQQAFMETLANELIDIMVTSGITVHGFSEEQMEVIWDYIRDKMH